MDNLRKFLDEVEIALDKVKREFYECDVNDEDKYEHYIKSINDKLLMCNNKLRKHNKKLEVVDSEIQLVTLLNKVRDLDQDIDQAVVDDLTEFWEHVKENLDGLKAVSIKYRTRVLKRMQDSCISYRGGAGNLELTVEYSEYVKSYKTKINYALKGVDELLRSFENGIKQELFTNTTFSQRVLVMCDQKAFPILRLFPDVSEKLTSVCRLSKQWVDKDETYMHDISNHIREARSQTRKKEQDLRNQKEKQEQLSNSMKESLEVFKGNKKRLHKIENELKSLEAQFYQCSQSKKYKMEERKQKEGMVGFLDISITQTKKNYSLQLKKSRLLRQLKELEENLKEIEEELSTVENEVKKTTQDKEKVVQTVEESNNAYKALKNDLDKFNENVGKIQQEVNNLTESLTSLEIIQTFKTSPEKVEDFFDRPSSVKLAPSLKEKIRRKRKLMAVRSK